MRRPEPGLVLLGGLDLRSLGETARRQRVASAPHFHENHALSNTLAFNRLMGRARPRSESDLATSAAARATQPAPLPVVIGMSTDCAHPRVSPARE